MDQGRIPVVRGYVNTARQHYGSEVADVNFIGNEGIEQINKWVESKTNSKIEELIPLGSTDELTRRVITNAVYFNRTWSTEFDEEDTREEDFHVSADKTVLVSIMNLHKKFFYYAETNEMQILEMPCQGGEASMLVLLPSNGTDIKSI